MKISHVIKVIQKIKLADLKKFIVYNMEPDHGAKGPLGSIGYMRYEKLLAVAKKTNDFPDYFVNVEIGALFGFSSQALLEGSHQKLIVIDNFLWNPIGLSSMRHEEMLRANLHSYARAGRVEVIRGTSVSVNPESLRNRVGIVFVDADHSYEGVKQDLFLADAVNARLICGDDYQFPGVERAVSERFGDQVRLEGAFWWVER